MLVWHGTFVWLISLLLCFVFVLLHMLRVVVVVVVVPSVIWGCWPKITVIVRSSEVSVVVPGCPSCCWQPRLKQTCSVRECRQTHTLIMNNKSCLSDFWKYHRVQTSISTTALLLSALTLMTHGSNKLIEDACHDQKGRSRPSRSQTLWFVFTLISDLHMFTFASTVLLISCHDALKTHE